MNKHCNRSVLASELIDTSGLTHHLSSAGESGSKRDNCHQLLAEIKDSSLIFV